MFNLILNLQDLPTHGRQWDWVLSKELLEDAHQGKVEPLADLCSDVTWKGQIERRGLLFLLHGEWTLSQKRQCDRCNAVFELNVHDTCNQEFSLHKHSQDDLADNEEELDTCEYLDPPGEVNLLDCLRESVWLMRAPVVICSANCKGLCPHCGVNLNKQDCTCMQGDHDSPFAALRNIKFD